MADKSKRRDFLKATTAVGVGYWVSTRSARAKSRSANERVNHAAIGAGGMGSGDVKGLAEKGANIVALCDVDEKRCAGTREKFPKAKFFHDFREMFDTMGDEIDSALSSQSGLEGLCGSADLRDVLARERDGDEDAAIAVEVYLHRIRKYIGAYTAALGRVDANR